MFINEIQNKSLVTLYDNDLQLLTHGIITGYKDQPPCIIVNDSLYYPVKHVSEIVVHSPSEPAFEQPVARLRT